MKHLVSILIICALNSVQTFSKDIYISEADTSKAGVIEFNIQSQQPLKKEEIHVTVNKKNIEFQFNQTKTKKAIFILVEISTNTTKTQALNLFDSITSVIAKSTTQTGKITAEYAFGYYNRADKNSNALNLLSTKFKPYTSKIDEELFEIKNKKIVASKWTDMYKAVYESLEWIDQHSEKYTSKQLIVIGTGKALSESSIRHTECIKRSKELKIEIATIGIPSNDRYAFDNFKLLVEEDPENYIVATNTNVANSALIKYLNRINYEYKLLFNLNPNNHTQQVNIKINGKENIRLITAIEKGGKFNKTIIKWIIISILILIIVSTIVILRIRRKQNYMSQNQLEDIDENPDTAHISPTISKTNDFTQVNYSRLRSTRVLTPPKTITIINPPKKETIEIITGITTFGRNNNNNIVIENNTVSGEHFRINYNGAELILENLSSSNGTYINNILQEKSMIYSGDIIRAGNVEIHFN